MDHHSGRFVDRYEVRIFVQDVEWDFLGLGAERRRSGRLDVDGLAVAHVVRGPRGAAVDEDAAGLDPILDPGAAELGQTLLEEVVETLAGVGAFGDEAQTCILLT
jgi:hypothetical protein